jgi:hypothetical protein
MPKSLSQGESKIVPVKMPDDEKQAAQSACKQGETLSAFVREAVRLLVRKRQRSAIAKPVPNPQPEKVNNG